MVHSKIDSQQNHLLLRINQQFSFQQKTESNLVYGAPRSKNILGQWDKQNASYHLIKNMPNLPLPLVTDNPITGNLGLKTVLFQIKS